MLEEGKQQHKRNFSSKNRSFNIRVMDKQFTIELPLEKTAQDLLDKIKEHPSTPYPERLLCLRTNHGALTLDYILSIHEERSQLSISKLKSNETFVGIYRESQHGPTLTLRDFTFERCIGKGGTSEVYLVRHKGSARMFALKMIRKQYISDCRRFEQILREKKILSSVLRGCRFVIPLYATFALRDYLCFLMEYLPGGELFFHLQNYRFSDEEARIYICEVVQAMEELHDRKVLYRDLKPENILVDLRGHLVLTDFGLSKVDLLEDELAHSFCGSPEYMPPEVVNRQGYSYAADYYTLGCLLYELVTGLPPFYSQRTEEIFHKIQNEEVSFPEDLDPECLQVLELLLEKNSHERLQNFSDLKRQKWFQGVDWLAVKEKRVEMPIFVDIYENHIHHEFLKVDVGELNLRNQRGELEPPEDLFDFFSYVNDSQKHVFQSPKVRVQSDHLIEKQLKKKHLQLNLEHSEQKGVSRTLTAKNCLTPTSSVLPLSLLRKSFQSLLREHPRKSSDNNHPTLSTVLSERPVIDKNYIQKMLQSLANSSRKKQHNSPPPSQELSWRPQSFKRLCSTSTHFKASQPSNISQRGANSNRANSKPKLK